MTGGRARTSFYDEQARHRRQTLRFLVLSVVAVVLAGIPVSVIITPLAFLATLIVAHLIDLAWPLGPSFWGALDQAGRFVGQVFEQVDRAVQANDIGRVDWTGIGTVALALVIPGMVLMLLLWVWVRILFRRNGVGGILLQLGARAPKPLDQEERQLGNLVEEMSIAAGVPVPRLMVLDRQSANAAAVGTGPGDAVLLVTRGLLTRLDRDATQAVVGHLIASIANGDLRIATRLLSVFQTFGLLSLLLSAAADPKARQGLWRAVKGVFWAGDRSGVEQVADLLAQGGDTGNRSGGNHSGAGCLAVVTLPFVMGAATAQFLSFIGASMVFGPLLAALWRARRYLADAGAVQLTRNPSALANALPLLEGGEQELKDAGTTSMLFVAWSGASKMAGGRGFHPSVARRRWRLEATGAKLIRHATGTMPSPSRRGVGWYLGRVIIVPLMIVAYLVFAVGIVVMLFAAAFLLVMSLVFITFAMFLIHSAFVYGPGIIKGIITEGPKIVKAIGALIAELTK